VRNWIPAAASTIALAFIGTFAAAAEIDLGTHSKDEIKNACNTAGGDLLGVSDSGAYGCEVASKGTMILCNKDSKCTGYTAARTRSDRRRILGSLNLTAKPVTQ
jgi:hypothetical protein